MYLNPDSIVKTETIPVRKPHDCYRCLSVIEKGTEAKAISFRHDSKLYKVYLHPACDVTPGYIKITPEFSQEPDDEVMCKNALGEKAYGYLKYDPVSGWYCSTGAGAVLNGITEYAFV